MGQVQYIGATAVPLLTLVNPRLLNASYHNGSTSRTASSSSTSALQQVPKETHRPAPPVDHNTIEGLVLWPTLPFQLLITDMVPFLKRSIRRMQPLTN